MEGIELYDVVKILHIVAVISWLAGLLYLPRIFVYHSQVAAGSETDKIFQVMERKLLHYIMNPAMILVFIFGFYLTSEIGFEFTWLHIKLTLVAILTFYHHLLSRWRKDFAKCQNKHSEKFYRIINELPMLLVIGIVSLVILKPF
ncbi:MAG: protoporphyrinogen oxidase HemJ [Alphaproteobacteria bacterium]|nr:protoporphyrinogen oxidase HemJ [Alphaproteobacteria bacterium]